MAYEITEAKEEVIRAGKELIADGLIARTWGNISARISETQFVITPSGLAYDKLTPEDIVTVNISDCSHEGTVKPSSEKGVHAAAYRLHPEVNFVIHTHQDYATDLSTLAEPVDVAKIDPEAVSVLGPVVPVAKYGLSSTKMLTKNVEAAIAANPASRAVLMRNHGPVCFGRDYADAFHIAHTLEDVCRKEFHRIVGGDIPQERYEDYSLMKFSRILRKEIHEEYDRHYLIFSEKPEINCVIETWAPYIAQMSAFGKTMKPYVDDLAQIAGMEVRCLPSDADDRMIMKALTGTCSAVFLKGKGAICTGGTQDDAEAVLMVLDKGCQAALLEKSGRHPKAVAPVGGTLEHVIYTAKYAKLKK